MPLPYLAPEQIAYSPSTGGFYSSFVHNLPEDAFPISAATHAQLVAGLAAGGTIVFNPLNGPTLVPHGQLTADQIRAVLSAQAVAEAQRRIFVFAPLWRQCNDNAALAAAAGDAPFDATELAAAWLRRDQINAVRAACRVLQASIVAAPPDALAQIDTTADVHWPAAPTPSLEI